jgi:pSer/pThr/pTyr-binding forkhead associated (FHA) protein
MSALPLFVEIIDRRGHILSRTRIDQLPVTIGRSYASTIIVDDEHIAGSHVQIEADQNGAIFAKDLGSQNGICAAGTGRTLGAKVTTLEVSGHHATEFLIGKTRVRIVPASAPVAPEKVLAVERAVPLSFVWGSIAALLAMVGFESWFSMVNEVKPLSIVNTLLTFLGALFIWAGGWAFITRLMRGVPKFAPHLVVAALGVIVFMVSSILIDALGFMFNLSGLYKWRGVFAVAMGALVIAAHVYLTNGSLSRWMGGFIGLAAAGVLSMSFLSSYQSHKTISPGGFMSSVFPPAWQLSGSKTTDDFFNRVKQDKTEIDALRGIDGDQESGGLD